MKRPEEGVAEAVYWTVQWRYVREWQGKKDRWHYTNYDVIGCCVYGLSGEAFQKYGERGFLSEARGKRALLRIRKVYQYQSQYAFRLVKVQARLHVTAKGVT